ncbi:MAG: GspH/FimT family pseudopilin [Gammaproteobacteria bacterium]|nr:GspH/FimT family pseudopilin [Gammaproteobacteria bacterium]
MGNCGKGFTLVELMVALGILGLTMAFAVPSFVTLISNNRISSSASDFVGSLQLAKAESAARTSPATICKKNIAGTGCVTAGDWQQGWIVFSDINGNAAVDAGDAVVLDHEPLDSQITFNDAGVTNSITFNPSGTTSITGTQIFIMCDARGFADYAKGILVTITGRGSVMKASDTGLTACL